MKIGDIVKLKTGEIAKIKKLINAETFSISYFNAKNAENGYFNKDHHATNIDEIEDFVIASVYCESCKNQSCITKVFYSFEHYNFCNKYQIILENKNMNSMAESVRCLNCLKNGGREI